MDNVATAKLRISRNGHFDSSCTSYRAGDKQQIAERFRVGFSDNTLYAAPGYNIAPTTTQPVIRLSRETDTREITPMRRGLVGHNASGSDPKRGTFNARSETIEKSPLWRVPFRRPRCLVPQSGFYEWCKLERKAFGIGVKDASLFALLASGTPGRTCLTARGFRASRSSPQRRTSSCPRCTIACRRSYGMRTTAAGSIARRQSSRPSICFGSLGRADPTLEKVLGRKPMSLDRVLAPFLTSAGR
ncbi:hypothetical protein D1Y84_00335 [Acidipila sp. EB88]|nr:hypothetical protein D1Y84_00335 [Acidipila sp. EB88]